MTLGDIRRHWRFLLTMSSALAALSFLPALVMSWHHPLRPDLSATKLLLLFGGHRGRTIRFEDVTHCGLRLRKFGGNTYPVFAVRGTDSSTLLEVLWNPKRSADKLATVLRDRSITFHSELP